MGTNEEYLDKLLQSVTKDEKVVEHDTHEHSLNMTDEELLASLVDMYREELADFVEEEIIHKEQTEEVSSDVVTDNIDTQTIEESVVEHTIDDILSTKIDEFEENEASLEEEYTVIDNNDMLSQDDIENLLNSLQEELPQETSEMVDTDKLIEDFSEEKDSVLQELLSEPQVLDEEDAELLLRDKEDDFIGNPDENLLDEMGIDGMSAEQIDDLLNAAAESEISKDTAENEASGEVGLDALFGGFSFADDFDPEHKASEEMADLLGGMLGGNDDLSEINDLLSKADNLDSADDSNLRNLLEAGEEIGGNDLLNELLQADSGEVSGAEDKKTKKTKEKKEKVKKEKAPKQPKEKKEGESFWKKLTSIMFEEEEEIGEDTKVKVGDGDELAALMGAGGTDVVLAEMTGGDKKKDKKKGKNKKDKADKPENANGEEGEETIDPKEKAKQEKLKEKAEKKAAKKKAKEEKAETDRVFLKAQPSISTKRAMVAVFFALSIMAIILIIYNFVPASIEKANARKAFYNKEYYECYELLQGKELNDSDKILLNKVTCILKMQRKLDAYNNYIKMDKNLEAVNLLMEAVELYEDNYTYARSLSIDKEYDAIYDEILLVLNGRYNISEEMAKEINAAESDAQYTIFLHNIIEGKAFGNNEEDEGKKPMEDILPEEKDFLEGQ